MRIIGLDIGEKRIGVARADSDTRIAVPYGYIEVDGSEWQEIARLTRMNNTTTFVLGLPRSNEGTETQQSLYVRNFAKMLLQKIPGARVRLQDESLTSVVAEERLKSRGKPYEKGDIDAEAAAIILQDFLEGLSSVKTPETPPEVDRAKLKAKKAKHKMKTGTKWMTGVGIVAVIAVIAVGVGLFIREERYREYQAWLAEQEALMAEESVFTFTIRPGETIFDVKQSLIGVGYDATEVEQAFNASYDFDFLKTRPQGATLEGYLYGETHEFYKDTPVKEILETYLKGMGEVISEHNLEAKYAEQGLTLFEGVTLASVVQKESNPGDMPTVAQVFLDRLDYGMLLGSDVTVSYALDVVDPYRQVYDENAFAVEVDSCYNTRKNAGLPCGPISNPGVEALEAVANPTDTSYLYFLTGDDGLMYYSYTEDEHLQNAAEHCQNLCAVAL